MHHCSDHPEGFSAGSDWSKFFARNFRNASVKGMARMAPVSPSRKAQPTSERVISRKEMPTACFMKIGVTTLSTIKLVRIKPPATSNALFHPYINNVTNVGGSGAITKPRVGMKSRQK